MENMMNKLRNLDAYPKINEDFYSRTLSGGVITLASSIVMLLLFLSELRKFLLFQFLPYGFIWYFCMFYAISLSYLIYMLWICFFNEDLLVC